MQPPYLFPPRHGRDAFFHHYYLLCGIRKSIDQCNSSDRITKCDHHTVFRKCQSCCPCDERTRLVFDGDLRRLGALPVPHEQPVRIAKVQYIITKRRERKTTS